MYHIPNDKRALTSAGIIVTALEECLKEKSYDNITITDICTPFTVSRPTFYRLFDNKDDVIAWKIEQFAQQFSTATVGSSTKETMEKFYAAWMQQPELLDLIIHIHREDIFYECHRKRADELGKYLLGIGLSEYHITVLTEIMVGILTTWAKNDRKESASELVEILCNVIDDLHLGIHSA